MSTEIGSGFCGNTTQNVALSAKKAFSASPVGPAPQKQDSDLFVLHPFSTARGWCARQGWALEFFLGQEDLGRSCWNLQRQWGRTRCQGHWNLTLLLVLLIARTQILVSVFPFSFIPVPFKRCGKPELICGGFGGLENCCSLGTLRQTAAPLSSFFALFVLVCWDGRGCCHCLSPQKSAVLDVTMSHPHWRPPDKN